MNPFAEGFLSQCILEGYMPKEAASLYSAAHKLLKLAEKPTSLYNPVNVTKPPISEPKKKTNPIHEKPPAQQTIKTTTGGGGQGASVVMGAPHYNPPISRAQA